MKFVECSKAVEGKVTASDVYVRKGKQARVSDPSAHIQKLGKEEQVKPNTSRGKGK